MAYLWSSDSPPWHVRDAATIDVIHVEQAAPPPPVFGPAPAPFLAIAWAQAPPAPAALPPAQEGAPDQHQQTPPHSDTASEADQHQQTPPHSDPLADMTRQHGHVMVENDRLTAHLRDMTQQRDGGIARERVLMDQSQNFRTIRTSIAEIKANQEAFGETLMRSRGTRTRPGQRWSPDLRGLSFSWISSRQGRRPRSPQAHCPRMRFSCRASLMNREAQ